MPLAAETIAHKGSSKPLINHGDLLNSVTYKILTPHSAFVGVLRQTRRKDNNAPMVNIARVHEFGFSGTVNLKGSAYTLIIPARPYLLPTLRENIAALRRNWLKAVKRAVELSV